MILTMLNVIEVKLYFSLVRCKRSIKTSIYIHICLICEILNKMDIYYFIFISHLQNVSIFFIFIICRIISGQYTSGPQELGSRNETSFLLANPPTNPFVVGNCTQMLFKDNMNDNILRSNSIRRCKIFEQKSKGLLFFPVFSIFILCSYTYLFYIDPLSARRFIHTFFLYIYIILLSANFN